jgi:hypothetical protein
MKLPNSEEFNFKDVTITGDECWLITPDSIKCKWTEDTLKFRSMIIRKSDHLIISRSFPKFFNYSEQPDLDKFPLDERFTAYEKLDGSLGIFDSYRGELLARTRGTSNLRQLENGHELDFLLKKYKKFFDHVMNEPDYTFLCEWQTNSNIIVVGGFPEPKLSLIGIIHKETGLMFSQEHLDDLAKDLDIPRPDKYHYESIQECVQDVEMWRGKEGVVLYSESGKMRKLKGEWYLSLHKIFTGMRSLSNILDFFLSSPRFVEYGDFYNYTVQHVDFELAEKIKDEMIQITEAYGKFIHSVNIIERAMGYISKLETRKEQALAIQKEWSEWSWMIPCAFSLLDNKPLDDKLVKKSMEKLLGL